MQQFNLTKTGNDLKGNRALYEALKSLPEGRWTITINKAKKKRSLPQNAYLHMVLQMIADETGNDLETVKSTVKAMYAKKPLLNKELEEIVDKTTGELVYYVQDTRDMTTVEMMDFVDNVRMFSQDFCNLILPLPNEQIDLKFKP